MKKTLLLLSMLFLYLIVAFAQTGNEAKVNGEPLDQYLANASRDKANIVMTGAWSAAQIATLKTALGAPNTLKTVNMSDFSFMPSETPIPFDLFANCQKLESIKMPINEITTPVALGNTKNQGLFFNCISLKEVDLSMFTNITDLQATFYCYAGGSKLETIKMPTKKSTITTQIPANNFVKNCPSLKGIDLSCFNYLSLTDALQKDKSLLYVVLPEQFSADPFTDGGVPFNPDFLVYAYSTYANKHNFANFITTTDGENYTCATAITLNPEKEFYCPKAFTATSISYTRDFTGSFANGIQGWNTLCLPFNATLNAGDTPQEPYASSTDTNGKYWLKALTGSEGDGKVSFDYSSSIMANTPYIIALPGNGMSGMESMEGKTITFTAGNIIVPATPKTLKGTTISNYAYQGTYAPIMLQPMYLLTRGAGESTDSFTLYDQGNIKPFRAYITALTESAKQSRSLIIGNGDGTATGFAFPQVKDNQAALSIVGGKGCIHVQSPSVQQVQVVAVDGRVIYAPLYEGDNTINGLQRGIYVVQGQKVAVY